MHEPRYAVLLETVRRLATPGPRVLDVGAADEATLLRELPGATVDTLGFEDERFPPRAGERHFHFDLKDAERRQSWLELEPYDVVVCAEVIEHVPVAPQHVIAFLASVLRPGGWLVLQTPNAARIANRARLLAGKNPFEPLREDSTSPGHFREYTVDELLGLTRGAGLELGGWLTANYFDTGTRTNALLRGLGRLVPRRLRAGVTLWARKPASTLPS